MLPKISSDFADNLDVRIYLSNTVIVRRLFCLALILGFIAPCLAQGNVDDGDKYFTADVLQSTLFARTPEEKRFCDYVIQKRDDGTIPSRLIYGIYQKALTKDRNRRFAYFKTGLEILCKREGIVLYPTPAQTSATTPTPSFISSAFIPSAIPSALRGLFQRNGR